MPLLPQECPNCGRLHDGADFHSNPGPVQKEVERLREVLAAKDDLLVAYRVGNVRLADAALNKLQRLGEL